MLITHYVKFRDPSNPARIWGIPSNFSPMKPGGAKVHRAAQDATVIVNDTQLAIPEGADLSVVLRGADVKVDAVHPKVTKTAPSYRTWPLNLGEGEALEEAEEFHDGSRWVGTGRTRPRVQGRRPSRVLMDGVFWRKELGRGWRGDRVPRLDLANGKWTEPGANLPRWYVENLPYADRPPTKEEEASAEALAVFMEVLASVPEGERLRLESV